MIDDTLTAMIPQWGSSTEMFALSQTLITQTESYATKLTNLAAGIFPPVINPAFPTLASAPVPIEAAMPALIDVAWTTPAVPAAFASTLNIAQYLPGPLTALQPTLNFPSPPASFQGVVPASPAIDLDFVYPTVELTLPSVPALMTLDTVVFNPLAIPVFDGIAPVFQIAAPSLIPYVEDASYTSALLTTVTAELTSALTSDTDIGLDAATQQAMWDAAREREFRAQADALDTLERDSALLGFAYPPGTFIDARIKIQTETVNTLAGLSRDIMVKQAELRLENVTKSRELAITLESKLIDYANQISQRAFDAAKYITEASVQIYNAEVQGFSARIEGFKATIAAYDAMIRGIEAQIAELKAQIEFESVKATINATIVQMYKVEVDAALATLEIYKTQVEIIQIEANVEKTKVDVFAAQIQAFAAQVNAYTAQVEGYKAGVQAQGEIETVYKIQVEAYSAQVNAGVAAAQALVAEYRGQVEAYTAQLDAYKAQLQAMTAQAQSASLYNQAEVAVYKGETEALAAYNQTLTAQWQAVINEQLQVTQVGVKAAEANGQLYIAAQQLSIDAAKAVAGVLSQLGAAALGAIRWSNSSSWGLSESLQTSSSITNNTSTNTNYNSSV